MRILFVHQNFPGQFKYLAPALAANPDNQVTVFSIDKKKSDKLNNVNNVFWQPFRSSSKDIHPWVKDFETKIIRSEAVYKTALHVKEQGFHPDVIIAHPGWGECLFLKEVWPDAKLGIYCEFFYHYRGADVGFDPEFPCTDEGEVCRIKLKNLNNILHFNIADSGISPTYWQASTFPESFRKSITVVHDGIDTRRIAPDPGASLTLNGSIHLTGNDEVITFVNRNLEPYRGYHIFMRALPEILRRRPRARVLIVGGNGVSYGPAPQGEKSWRDIYIDEVRGSISDSDWSRVHYLGHIDYQHFIVLLQISSVHVYLTYPFVLSWSLLEAMSAGCTIVASDTRPLHEAITHDLTGRLVDFFDATALSDEVCSLLDDAPARARLGNAARAFAIANYDLESICLPRQIDWVRSLASS